MKKLALLVFLTLLSTVSFAQLQLATLNHNDSITVFYGGYALRDAHEAAVTGDIISLSPGAFRSVDITKAVRIYGAGMASDTIAGTFPTVLLDNFDIKIADDSVNSLYMEGLSCSGGVVYDTIYHPYFSKCYFMYFTYYYTSSFMKNATFVNCVLSSFNNGYGINGNGTAQSPLFINSVILDFRDNGNKGGHYGNWTFVNCVAHIGCAYTNYGSIQNSVVYDASGTTSVNAYSSYNSIGINTATEGGGAGYNYYYTKGISNHAIYNYRSYDAVFKTFRGSYDEGITFELQDSIAAKCLGNDGTQVGIYGGYMPFDPSVRNPLIKKVNVAPRSNAEGKLEVEVEVVSE